MTPEITAPNGHTYLPFQKEGIEWMLSRTDMLLADAMGLGKTIQAIGLINTLPGIKKTLIICPASLKLNWRNELMTWLNRPIVIQIIDSKSEWLETDITIINYEQIQKFRKDINKVNWDLLILDESHYLKNSKAQRTQHIFGHWDNDPAKRIFPIKAAKRLCMTGTPILNRPKELWTTVRALDRQALGADWMKFHTRYCGAYRDRFGWKIDGASNLEELNSKLQRFMLRRKKEDVLPQLPPKRRQLIMLEPVTIAAKQALDAEQELLKAENEINTLRAEVERLSVNQTNEAYKKAVQKLASVESVAFGESAKLRHNTARSKMPMAMEHLMNVLESEEKIVVFNYHHDIHDQLVEGLAEFGIVHFDGRIVDTAKRQAAVDKFQHDPKVRIIVGSIPTMGSGWTLTAASYVAFVELDWVPGNLNQAEDRLHRIGQKKSILIQHLMLNGSFDGRMAKSVMHKQQVIERAVG